MLYILPVELAIVIKGTVVHTWQNAWPETMFSDPDVQTGTFEQCYMASKKLKNVLFSYIKKYNNLLAGIRDIK